MRPAAAVSALALAAALAGCGGDGDGDRDARACAGASTGDAALHGSGHDIEARVHEAEDRAADAARALPRGDPGNPADTDAQAVKALLAQSLRLRLVRSQIQREERAPAEVLHAAAAGLTAGDRIVRERLAAAGVTC